MRFYFVRHGTTINNQNHTFNGGGVDPVLTDAGQREAYRLGKMLATVNFDLCFSSPLKRAQKTAELVLQANTRPIPQIKILPTLTEMDLGKWDGVAIDDLKKDPQIENYFYAPDRFNGHLIQAETYQDVKNRAYKALQDICSQIGPNQNILVISHGLLLTTLLKSLCAVPLHDIRKDGLVPTSSVTIFESSDGQDFHLKKWAIKPLK